MKIKVPKLDKGYRIDKRCDVKRRWGHLFIKKLQEKFYGVITAVSRYPSVVVFLLAAAIVNMMMIHNDGDSYMNILLTFIVGAVLSLVAQQVYERFFTEVKERVMLQVGAIVLTIGYYFAIQSTASFTMELEIKTAIALFALLMVFTWVPAIKSELFFNRTFMAVFKAFFTTLLFTAVISIGLNLSIFAVDTLLVAVDFKVYMHVLNIIVTLFSPLFFLSLIPLYLGKNGEVSAWQRERIEQATACPKVLAVLLSYVIIPLSVLYTVILLAYVLLNIRSDFWTDNLLEPMLVSYAITIILVMILASSLTNSFASLFKKVLPKVLIPIVLFQLIASVLKIGEAGLTHGRYYVLLFGLFALVTSLIFSFFPIEKSGWIAAILIVFSAVSIIPPVDAYTVSRVNQTNLLARTLEDNGMLKDGEVIPNADIAIEDKQKITRVVNYLDQMNYVKKIDWLPNQIRTTTHFKKTFGFTEVYDGQNEQYRGQSAYLEWENSSPLNVEDYDRMTRLTINYDENNQRTAASMPLTIKDNVYHLEEAFDNDEMYLMLVDEESTLIRLNITEAFNQILEKDGALDVETATVTEENEAARISLVANFVDLYGTNYNGEFYVFIEIK